MHKSENRSREEMSLMSNAARSVENQQVLERLSRQGSQGAAEVAVVTSPGARTAAWAVKVKSHSSYNVYDVIAVVIHDPGAVPSEIGQQTQAVNMAESFTQ
ncbi:MAG: hypothetical protein ACYTEK_05470, partial [Planctomycetota bacterium]